MNMMKPPRTVEIVTSTSGWSKPASRIDAPNTTITHTQVKYRRLSVQRALPPV